MNILKVKTEKRRIGDIGERAAVKFLRKSKYKILEKNYIPKPSITGERVDVEIDIIAATKDSYVFVEVKTRTISSIPYPELRPASAVTHETQNKIFRAAQSFKAQRRDDKKMRFDIIEVYLTDDRRVSEIKHLVSAFDRGTAYIEPWKRNKRPKAQGAEDHH